MNTTILYIKNMVCNRCIRVVDEEMTKAGYTLGSIELGRVELQHKGKSIDLEKIAQLLKDNGFELIEDKKRQLVDAVKTTVISRIHHEGGGDEKIIWSELLSEKLPYDYKYLSQLFSSLEGITIEQYIIQQKIEKVKELIVYNDLSLSEIAWQLGYSSVGHLSNQFKKVTGMSPRAFRDLGLSHRKTLDEV
jgi:AraC family transcriptional regulator